MRLLRFCPDLPVFFSRRKFDIIFIGALSVILLLVTWFKCDLQHTASHYDADLKDISSHVTRAAQTVADLQNDVITILPWHKRFVGDPKLMWFDKGTGPAAFEKCQEPRCSVVNDSFQADAVLVSSNFLSTHNKEFKLPGRTGPTQKWIFYSRESPQNFIIKPEYFRLFNGSFTYHSISDAHNLYGKIIPLENPLNISVVDEYWDTKKNVGWIVSHCNTAGGREHYVAELAKHIDVAIYGECGNHTCPVGVLCRHALQNEYKFYLAFENSACVEYATEKLFAALTTNMIPIVYGYYDYQKNLPANSYIDVRDYKSPKHLAEYLKIVSSNKTLFESYFQWKTQAKVKHYFYDVGTCELCEYLHRTRNDPPKTFDLELMWNEEFVCIPKRQFLKSVGVDIQE